MQCTFLSDIKVFRHITNIDIIYQIDRTAPEINRHCINISCRRHRLCTIRSSVLKASRYMPQWYGSRPSSTDCLRTLPSENLSPTGRVNCHYHCIYCHTTRYRIGHCHRKSKICRHQYFRLCAVLIGTILPWARHRGPAIGPCTITWIRDT